jgi:peroxiredoxin
MTLKDLLGMPALESGISAPEINLPLLGGGNFVLSEARKHGPVALAFFKASCPVCQMAFPFYERLHQAYRGTNVQVVGISQDSAQDTSSFAKQFGISFPIALDDTKRYPASNAYGLTNVPTLFLVSTDGQIEISSVSWCQDELEAVNQRLAGAAGKDKKQIVKPSDNVPSFKPG